MRIIKSTVCCVWFVAVDSVDANVEGITVTERTDVTSIELKVLNIFISMITPYVKDGIFKKYSIKV